MMIHRLRFFGMLEILSFVVLPVVAGAQVSGRPPRTDNVSLHFISSAENFGEVDPCG